MDLIERLYDSSAYQTDKPLTSAQLCDQHKRQLIINKSYSTPHAFQTYNYEVNISASSSSKEPLWLTSIAAFTYQHLKT